MSATNITNARKNLFKLIKNVQATHEPLMITGKIGSVVMISEEDWRSIEETLFLVSIPNMRESIMTGLKEPLDTCKNTLKW